MRRKIMFFLYTLSGGGAERTVVNILNHLDEKKYEVILVLGTNKNNDYCDFLSKNIRIKILNSKRLRYSLIRLIKAINEEKPDILFSTLNNNNIILLLAKTLTFKKVPTIVREANNRTKSGTVTIINKWMTYFFYNYIATKIIALSQGVKNDLVENFSIEEKKISVIYNPVDIQLIKKLKNENVEELNIKRKERLIIAVGRLVDQKDYPTLLKAFKIIASSKVNVRLIILGKGPLKKELKTYCEKLNIKNNVLFLGFKKNPYKYMKKSDLFVLSSKWEGFGHVIVEAMVTGTPVISTNCNSGPSEILEDNKYGILVPVEDHVTLSEKIIDLLENEELREKYIKQGYIRAEKFNVKNIVNEYEKIFDEVNY